MFWESWSMEKNLLNFIISMKPDLEKKNTESLLFSKNSQWLGWNISWHEQWGKKLMLKFSKIHRSKKKQNNKEVYHTDLR